MKKTIKYTDKELAQAHVFPHGLSAKDKKKADEQLLAIRKERLHQMTPDKLMIAGIMQLKFTMENYISGSIPNTIYSFAYFLKEYIHQLDIKKNEFAKEISIHSTLLSRLLNNREEPNEKLFIRLEIHSNNMIPAIYWQQSYERQKELALLNNREIRKTELKYVKSRLIRSRIFSKA